MPVASATLTLQPGDAIVPHLYDWFLDGADDYIVYPTVGNPSSELSALTYVNIHDIQRDAKILGKAQPGRGGYVLGIYYGKVHPEVWDTAGVLYGQHCGSLTANTWVWLWMTWKTSGRFRVYVNLNNVLDIPASSNNIGSTTNMFHIGKDPWGAYHIYHGLISSVMVYHREIGEAPSIIGNRIIPSASLILFTDPTFFDGVRFLDLSGLGNHGNPYGGIQRVPASSTWVWVLRGYNQDGSITALVPPQTRFRCWYGRCVKAFENTTSWAVFTIPVPSTEVYVEFEG